MQRNKDAIFVVQRQCVRTLLGYRIQTRGLPSFQPWFADLAAVNRRYLGFHTSSIHLYLHSQVSDDEYLLSKPGAASRSSLRPSALLEYRIPMAKPMPVMTIPSAVFTAVVHIFPV